MGNSVYLTDKQKEMLEEMFNPSLDPVSLIQDSIDFLVWLKDEIVDSLEFIQDSIARALFTMMDKFIQYCIRISEEEDAD